MTTQLSEVDDDDDGMWASDVRDEGQDGEQAVVHALVTTVITKPMKTESNSDEEEVEGVLA